MRMRIRTKFIGILILAAVVPLVLAMMAAQFLSYRYYRKAQGTLFETRAEHLAHIIGITTNKQLENLDRWLALSELHERIRSMNAELPPVTDAKFHEETDAVETRWPQLSERDPLLAGLLNNELATRLRAFQALHPLFVEVFITDASGRLAAATQKPAKFWNAAEPWWQEAMALKGGQAYVEGINYDSGTRLYSVNVALPICLPMQPHDEPLGVIRAVVNVSPLLSTGELGEPPDGSIRELVLSDGQVLADLSGHQIEPLSWSIQAEATKQVTKKPSGWLLARLGGDHVDLVGFAQVRLKPGQPDDMEVTGVNPMYVLVFNAADTVLSPVRRQLALLGLAGTALVLGCALTGYEVAERKILRPIERLRRAAQTVAASAKLDESDKFAPVRLPELEPIRQIKTGDELQMLAGDFDYMASRVLTYHERLEREIAAKTAAIDRDLQMARDFQEALMPREFPQVPTAPNAGAMRLNFHHIYQPASTVSGDFYDVLKLSDHRAGILIADVMGHGTRSALVTAIVHALMQDLAYDVQEPALFLASLNRHFYDIVSKSSEVLFVSAFYLVLDTRSATASYASAGHPSPFIADRRTGEVSPLLASLRNNPALGLVRDCAYRQWSRPIRADQLFVLFTDGAFEACNGAGDEFGIERIRETIAGNLGNDVERIDQSIVEALRRFIHPAEPDDDVCLVTIETASVPAALAIAKEEPVPVGK